jgi:hypothetical protein
MKKRYVKNDKGYEKCSEYDEKKIRAAMKRLKAKRKSSSEGSPRS